MQKKGFPIIKNYSTDFSSSAHFRSVPREHSGGPCTNSMMGIDWDTWRGKRAHVPLQNHRLESQSSLGWKGPLQDIWSKPLVQTRARLQVRSNYGLLQAVELALH